jgi:hypothetical protein
MRHRYRCAGPSAAHYSSGIPRKVRFAPRPVAATEYSSRRGCLVGPIGSRSSWTATLFHHPVDLRLGESEDMLKSVASIPSSRAGCPRNVTSRKTCGSYERLSSTGFGSEALLVTPPSPFGISAATTAFAAHSSHPEDRRVRHCCGCALAYITSMVPRCFSQRAARQQIRMSKRRLMKDG